MNCIKLNSVYNLDWVLWSFGWEGCQQKWLLSSLAARWGFVRSWLFTHALGAPWFHEWFPSQAGEATPNLCTEYFFRRTFLSLSYWELNFNKELHYQGLENNSLILLYLLFWKILVEEHDPFIVKSGLKRKRLQGTERCEAALVPVTVLLNLLKVFHF